MSDIIVQVYSHGNRKNDSDDVVIIWVDDKISNVISKMIDEMTIRQQMIYANNRFICRNN